MANSSLKCSDEEIIEVCSVSKTMAEACSKTQLHFNTFKRRALNLQCYSPNQGGKGITGEKTSVTYTTDDILQGKFPHYQTYKLRNRLIKENILPYKCAICGICEWNGIPLSLELDHINGDHSDHVLNNLRLICPNCHSQTDTYRGKNSKTAV